MTTAASGPPWTKPGWLERVSAWIHAELENLDTLVTDPIEQPHVRPWSTVLRIPTSNGDVFFKACAQVLTHEVVVTQALAHWYPDCTPKVLASDPEQGWMLMADGGMTAREAIKTEGTLRHWEKLLPRYAELQIELVGHAEELLVLGIPDRRMAALPGKIERLLDDEDMLRIDQPDGLTAAEYHRLRGMVPHLIARCERLAAYGIPESIHHGDFHDANIFLDGDSYVFFDWGDSSIAHPFFSLRTAFVIIEHFQGLTQGAPEYDRLRDAYLEPWRHAGTREDLLAAFALSARLSPLSSALGWARVVSSLEEPLRAHYADAVPSLLQEFLELEDQAVS